MTTYSTTVLKLPATAGLLAIVAVGLAMMFGAVTAGYFADRIGRWPIMFWSRLATAVLSVPAFLLLVAQPSVTMLLAVSAVLAFLTGANGTGALTAICELFPRDKRATSLALAYSIGVALFGGTPQFVVTWLINYTGNPVAPAWYVVATSIVALLATFFLPETRPRSAALHKSSLYSETRTHSI